MNALTVTTQRSDRSAEIPPRRRVIGFILILIGLPVLGLALLLSYGHLFLFLGCIGLIGCLAILTRKAARGFSITLSLLAVGTVITWGVDSSVQYPLLRKIQASVPFGPGITVERSPSGRTTAYIYNYSFLDSAYAVSFAQGRSFPGKLTWIRYDKESDFSIHAQWNGSIFRVVANGGPEVLTYSETTNRVTALK